MRTETIEILKYEELNEAAQSKARDRWRECQGGLAWSDEWCDTIAEAAEEFGFTILDWRVDCGYGECQISVEDDASNEWCEMKGARVWKYIQKHHARTLTESCPFTGYCGDESFLDPMRAFLAKPDSALTYGELLETCATAWAMGWAQDMEWSQRDEQVADAIIANEYEFTADGTRY